MVRGFLLVCALAILSLPFLAKVTGDFLLTCRFHEMTGLSCPTCGLTRSFQSLVHLDLIRAMQFHILGPILYVAVFILIIKWGLELILKRSVKPILNTFQIRIFGMIVAGVWLVFWLSRLILELVTKGGG